MFNAPQWSRTIRIAVGLTVTIGLGALSAACQSPFDHGDSARPTATASGDGRVPGPGASGGASGPAGAGGNCTSAQIQAKAANAAGGAAAGHLALSIRLTNSGTQSCTLQGYPGVAFVTGPSGDQVGDAATRSRGTQPTLVTVAPRGSAAVVLRVARPDVFDPATCRPATAAGLRISLPGDTGSIFASSPQTVCSAKGVGVGEVGPVEAAS